MKNLDKITYESNFSDLRYFCERSYGGVQKCHGIVSPHWQKSRIAGLMIKTGHCSFKLLRKSRSNLLSVYTSWTHIWTGQMKVMFNLLLVSVWFWNHYFIFKVRMNWNLLVNRERISSSNKLILISTKTLGTWENIFFLRMTVERRRITINESGSTTKNSVVNKSIISSIDAEIDINRSDNTVSQMSQKHFFGFHLS